MGMAHYSSGKNGFQYYSELHIARIPDAKLKEIYILEDQYRSSKEYQDKYNEKDDLNWFQKVTLELQRRVLLETGILDRDILMTEEEKEKCIKSGLEELWSSRQFIQNNPEFNQLTVYLREDRSRMGGLMKNETIPDVAISDRNGNTTTMCDYYKSLQKVDSRENRYLFLIAGSVS